MKIGIIGSEATRGIFMFNAYPSIKYKTQIISYQTTTVSNMASPVRHGEDFSSYTAWDKMIVEGNLCKNWAQKLKESAPDVVIFDFVPDVMYHSVEYGDSVITRNPIVLKYLKNRISNHTPVHSDEEKFFEAWASAAKDLVRSVREVSPESLIVLHSAQLLNTYIDKEGIPRKTRKADYAAKNALLKKMNTEAETLFDFVLKSDPLKFHGHELHPWGVGPAKYEFKYNTHMLGLFANKVLERNFGGGN